MLDVGCGGGKSTQLFLEDFENILGIDISESQISFAKRTIKKSNVNFQVVHDDLFPVDSRSVDLIFCGESFHYMNGPTFLAECDRVLVPGGMLVCVVYGPDVLKTLDGKLIAECVTDSKLWKLQHNFFTNCGMDNKVRDTFLSKYRDTFNALTNPTKKILHIGDINLKYTTQMLIQFFSTCSGYKTKVFNDPDKDPLNILRGDIKELLEDVGMEFDDRTEFMLTYPFTAMVVEKTQDFGLL